MVEVIGKMGFCMVPSLLIGGGIGWLISKMIQEKKTVLELDILRETLKERDRQFKNLEESHSIQEVKLNKVTDEGIITRHQLLQKSNLLRKTSDDFHKNQSRLENLERLEEEKSKLIEELTQLKTLLEEKNKIIDGFEEVLIKADNVISNNEKKLSPIDPKKTTLLEFEIEKLKKIVAERNRKILHYEKEIKKLKTKNKKSEAEESFLISRDQFKEIEKRLIEFKDRIEILKEENAQLLESKQNKNTIRNTLFSKMGKFMKKGKTIIDNPSLETNSSEGQQELKNI